MNTLSEDGQWMYDGNNWVPSDLNGPGNPPSGAPKIPPKKPMNKPPRSGERMSDIGWWVSQGTTQFFILIGFIMMIMSAGYAHSAEYTDGPTAPDQDDYILTAPDQEDYDVDGNGLEVGELENYTLAFEEYLDLQEASTENYTLAFDEYEDLETQHQKDRNQDTGNAAYWISVGPGFIVLGLVVFCLNDNSKEMSNSLRITMVIGTLYLLSNMLFEGSAINLVAGIGAN